MSRCEGESEQATQRAGKSLHVRHTTTISHKAIRMTERNSRRREATAEEEVGHTGPWLMTRWVGTSTCHCPPSPFRPSDGVQRTGNEGPYPPPPPP